MLPGFRQSFIRISLPLEFLPIKTIELVIPRREHGISLGCFFGFRHAALPFSNRMSIDKNCERGLSGEGCKERGEFTYIFHITESVFTSIADNPSE